MSAVVYGDLIDGLYNALLSTAQNVGSYAPDVPEQLKSTFSYTQSFVVTNGHTPKVVWANSSSLSVCPLETFQSQFNDFCNTWLLTNDAHKGTPITTPTVLKFITAMVAFITCKFAKVYSHFTTTTSIFYFSGNTVNTNYIENVNSFYIDTTNVDSLLTIIINSATSGLKGFCATSGYTMIPQ